MSIMIFSRECIIFIKLVKDGQDTALSLTQKKPSEEEIKLKERLCKIAKKSQSVEMVSFLMFLLRSLVSYVMF